MVDGEGERVADGQTYPIHKNMHSVLPFGIKSWDLKGNMQIIASEPGNK